MSLLLLQPPIYFPLPTTSFCLNVRRLAFQIRHFQHGNHVGISDMHRGLLVNSTLIPNANSYSGEKINIPISIAQSCLGFITE
jgi:hypothetical protein